MSFIAFVWILTAYLLGTFPSAQIWTKLFTGKDITAVGSKNPGTLNTLRSAGLMPGFFTLFTDVSKGILAVLPALTIHHSLPLGIACGITVTAGHNWSIFSRFRGGKGLAATCGAVLMLSPVILIVLLAMISILSILLKDSNKGTALGVWFLPLGFFLTFGSLAVLLLGGVWAELLYIKFRGGIN